MHLTPLCWWCILMEMPGTLCQLRPFQVSQSPPITDLPIANLRILSCMLHTTQQNNRHPLGGQRATDNLRLAIHQTWDLAQATTGRAHDLLLAQLGRRVVWYSMLFPGRVTVLRKRPAGLGRLRVRVAAFGLGTLELICATTALDHTRYSALPATHDLAEARN